MARFWPLHSVDGFFFGAENTILHPRLSVYVRALIGMKEGLSNYSLKKMWQILPKGSHQYWVSYPDLFFDGDTMICSRLSHEFFFRFLESLHIGKYKRERELNQSRAVPQSMIKSHHQFGVEKARRQGGLRVDERMTRMITVCPVLYCSYSIQTKEAYPSLVRSWWWIEFDWWRSTQWGRVLYNFRVWHGFGLCDLCVCVCVTCSVQ